MATRTLYGVAPLLPPLVPALDHGLESTRGLKGGWHTQQQGYRRTALGTALGFICAGLVVLALVSTPTYGEARDARDPRSSGVSNAGKEANIDDLNMNGVSSDGSFVASRDSTSHARLGALRNSEDTDEHALLQTLGNALPNVLRDRLLQVFESSRVMPDTVFQSLAVDARTIATSKSFEERKQTLPGLLNKLRRVVTMDDTTVRLVSLFAEEEEEEEEETIDNRDDTYGGVSGTTPIRDDKKGAFSAVVLVRVVDAFRRFPRWTLDDALVFTRAAETAGAETWSEFPSKVLFEQTHAKLGASFEGASDGTWTGDDELIAAKGNGDAVTAVPLTRVPLTGVHWVHLTGVKPPLRDTQPVPLSKHASAPGAASLGRSNSIHRDSPETHDESSSTHDTSSKHADPVWGFGTRGDAGITRTLREGFDPESVDLPRSFDSRVAFPKCAEVLGTVRDQGKCGSCWAVAVVEVMNDRLCVATDGTEKRELSPEYPLTCFESSSGCDGGDVVSTFREAAKRGVPYGGMGVLDTEDLEQTNDATESTGEAALGKKRSFGEAILGKKRMGSYPGQTSCLPYEFEACDHPCQEQVRISQ